MIRWIDYIIEHLLDFVFRKRDAPFDPKKIDREIDREIDEDEDPYADL